MVSKRDVRGPNFKSKICVGLNIHEKAENLCTVVMGKTEVKRKQARLRCNPWKMTEILFRIKVLHLTTDVPHISLINH